MDPEQCFRTEPARTLPALHCPAAHPTAGKDTLCPRVSVPKGSGFGPARPTPGSTKTGNITLLILLVRCACCGHGGSALRISSDQAHGIYRALSHGQSPASTQRPLHGHSNLISISVRENNTYSPSTYEESENQRS